MPLPLEAMTVIVIAGDRRLALNVLLRKFILKPDLFGATRHRRIRRESIRAEFGPVARSALSKTFVGDRVSIR